MSGYQNPNPEDFISKGEFEKFAEQLKNVKPETLQEPKLSRIDQYIESVKKQPDIQECVVKRKVILNGKMAPKGHVYIVVMIYAFIKGKNTKLQAHKLIKGGQGQDIEDVISSGLIHGLKMKHGI